MTYYCQDCSYRGQTAGPTGDCPACGSFALVRAKQTEDEPPPSKLRLYIMFALWAVFLGMVGWKLVQ